MLSVQNNILAMNAERQYGINQKKKEKSAEKLASGYKINRAADDAAGLSISEKMRRQIRGLQKGKENITDGISWVQIGDGAMEEIAHMIHRMEELAVKGASETLQVADRAAIHEEITQLKREINDIAKSTVFNEKKIFDNDQIDINIEGYSALSELQIYDATYDDATGSVTYGGIVYQGNRMSWDQINPHMVTVDANGEQIFNGGNYDFTINGHAFHVECKQGAKVPDISRTVNVEASDGGISIDGEMISWGDLYDEDGRTAAQTCHDGTWYADHNGMTISYYFPEGSIGSKQDMIDAIATLNTHDSKVRYHLGEFYKGASAEQAVDVVKAEDLRLSDYLVKELMHDGAHNHTLPNGTVVNPHQLGYLDQDNHFSVVVRASKADPNDASVRDGIWLEYQYECDDNGAPVEAENSYRTWEQLGLKDWFNGTDVKGGEYEYTYRGDNGDANVDGNETFLSFKFKLSDITSKDSVIDGLDGMVISGGNIKTKYEAKVEFTPDTNILGASYSEKTNVTFQEEKDLGRIFDNKEDMIGDPVMKYDETTGKVSLTFQSKDPQSTAEMKYTGINEAQQAARMDTYLRNYALDVERKKIELALLGEEPVRESLKPPYKSLTDVLGGPANITTDGYLKEKLKIEADMVLSDGETGYKKGEVGKIYPAAKIDFKGMSAPFNLNDLVGAGFNSTCKTCNNHYSIVFDSDVAGASATADGYKYKYEKDGQNHKLTLDVKSFSDNGVNDATKLAEAIVAVTSECFDFHYTQYAAKNGTLYVYDNRADLSGANKATFNDWAYDSKEQGDFTFTLKADNGSTINTNYRYSLADFDKNIDVKMEKKAGGTYRKLDSGSYIEAAKYDSALHGPSSDSNLYNPTVVYYETDANGNRGSEVAGLADAKKSYTTYAFHKMMESSKVTLKAMDYTMMSVKGDEKENVAIRSIYDTDFIKEIVDNGINIRCSAQEGDRTSIPRFGVNTFSLNLYRAGAKTQEQADRTIEITKKALELLNEKRTIYGVMQNRLEHAFNMRDNTQENTQDAESRIRDTDVAKETLIFSNQNIMMQAGVSMMTQANSSSQYALSLLQ